MAAFEVYPEMAYDNRTVILRGTVDNLLAKQAAAQDAHNTVGVRAVDNRIKVRPGAVYDDEKLASRVHEALARNPYVDGYEIRVTVTNGVADLYGTVDSYYEKTQADDTAAKVKGIIMVDDNLSVRRSSDPYYYNPYLDRGTTWDVDGFGTYTAQEPAKSDAAIEGDIRDQLWWSPFVDEDDVEVTVEAGRATLTGTVQSWSEYNAATTNAYDGGAAWVDNDLVLTYP